MTNDEHTFFRRAQKFFLDLKSNRFPNAVSLAEHCQCSRNTAQRTIYRLRDEYLLPLDYDNSSKGYFLKDRSFEFPTFIPPGKDELTALLLVQEMIRSLDAEDLKLHLASVWSQFATNNAAIVRDIEPLRNFFSCEATVVADIADTGVLKYVMAAQAGESVRIAYKSPWRHQEVKIYEGQVLKVHFSDGNLYILFGDCTGRELVLNSSFVRDFTVLDYSIKIHNVTKTAKSSSWLDGFGVWAGETVSLIEVHVLPPAAEYYAAQRWHVDQVDTFCDEVLVRRLPGIVSPEIVRRILSLGRYVAKVEPLELRRRVLDDARALIKNLEGGEVESR